jgi:hypothetical protein
MATKILLKKSVTGGASPLTSDLDQGELAINLVDRKIYTKDSGNNIKEITGAYVDSVAPANPVEGDVWYDTTNNLLKAYNGSTFESAGYQTLGALEDVTLTSIASGDHLTWNGSAFVNSNLESDVEGFLSVVSSGDGSLALSGGEFTYTGPSAAEQQAHFSAVDAGGDGSFSYLNGVYTYTGPSASEAQAHFTAANTGTGYGTLSYAAGEFSFAKVTDAEIRGAVSAVDAGGDGSLSYDNTTGEITYTGPSAAEVQAHITAGTGVTITNGSVAIGQDVETTSDVTFNKLVTDTIEGGSTITIDPAATGDNTCTVIIAGNLTVEGTQTSVNSNEVNIGDAVILLNANEVNAASLPAGIEIERGTDANVSFLWNEADDAWDLGNETLQNVVIDGGTY